MLYEIGALTSVNVIKNRKIMHSFHSLNLRFSPIFLIALERGITSLLQPRWCPQKRHHWRRPARSAQQPHAVRGTSGYRQAPGAQCIWQ